MDNPLHEINNKTLTWPIPPKRKQTNIPTKPKLLPNSKPSPIFSQTRYHNR